MADLVRLLAGTTAQWAASDAVLAYGQVGIDTDLRRMKTGDGVNAWSVLPWMGDDDADAGHLVEGRLTLTSGIAVTTSDVTGAGTIYFTPNNGNRVRIYDGTDWVVHEFTERSLALTVASGNNYDVFIYDNAGTLTLELSAAWTNDTTRADALVLQDGVYVKSGATTCLHLGTIRASGANVTEDSESKRFVSNRYNKAPRKVTLSDGGDSSYGTATWRIYRGVSTNIVEFILTEAQLVHVFGSCQGSHNSYGSVGLDATNGTGNALASINNQGNSILTMASGGYTLAAEGYHYLAPVHFGGNGSSEFYAMTANGVILL